MERKVPTIYEKSLHKARGEVSASAFAFLFSELVQYTQNKVSSIEQLEEKLAEAGHQVSQENLAHLIDSGKASSLFNSEEFRLIYAQRFYELAAAQGSIASELKLGDYAYYGIGIDATMVEDEEDGGVNVIHIQRNVDYIEAASRYTKVKEGGNKVMSLMGGGKHSPAWISNIVNTAEFNLACMYYYGLGLRQNMMEAGKHFRRSIPADSHGKWIMEWLVDKFVAEEYVSEVEEDDVVDTDVDEGEESIDITDDIVDAIFPIISLGLLSLLPPLLKSDRRFIGSSRNKILSFLKSRRLISDLLVGVMSD
jgi:hypothetical protein